MLRNFGIKTRIFALLGLLVFSTVLASGAFWVGMVTLSNTGIDQAENAMLEGFQRTLKYSVQAMATKVGDAIAKAGATGEERTKLVQSELQESRYGENGYFLHMIPRE